MSDTPINVRFVAANAALPLVASCAASGRMRPKLRRTAFMTPVFA